MNDASWKWPIILWPGPGGNTRCGCATAHGGDFGTALAAHQRAYNAPNGRTRADLAPVPESPHAPYARLLPLALAVMDGDPAALVEVRRLSCECPEDYRRLEFMLLNHPRYGYGKTAERTR